MNKSLLIQHIQHYIKSQSKDKEQAKDGIKERKERISFYQSYTKDKILKMTEEEFYDYISKLWAMLIWGNKRYAADKIVNDNGFDVLKNQLANLIWGNDPIEKRWDSFRKNIKGFGPAMISELLCHTHPEEYMIWNKKAFTAFIYLEIPGVPKYDYQLTGEKYQELCKRAKEILLLMKEQGIENANLLVVDYFLWQELQIVEAKEKADIVKKVEIEKEKPEINEFKHNDIRDKLAQIGTFLGFDTRTEQKVADGSKVDTVWEMKVGNMGRILYVFEVQTKGSIDSLIVNLLKALNNPAVQGVVAVSDIEQLEKIKRHTADVANLGMKIKFWNYDEVLEVYDSLAMVNETINRLGLVPASF